MSGEPLCAPSILNVLLRRYTLRTRGERIFGIALCSFVGGLFVLSSSAWSLGLLSVNHRVRPSTTEDWFLALLLFGGGLLGLFFAWGFLREPYEVRLADDGRIELLGMMGSRSTTIGDIRVIEKFVQRVILESDDPRRVRLTYVGGSAVLSNVAELQSLVEELVRSNPNVQESGRWPSSET